ncbi:histidine phosphatase family protein [Thioalkalivibrio sp. ARh3]|uniref:histidine phosphatase family protein n=1 Tax=Thioalkalivibrio sp. ARh3 TaxID=1158148 RepID=UPI0005703864
MKSRSQLQSLVHGLAATALLAGGGVLAPVAAADEAAWDALAEGGVVVMLRHTESEEADQERSMYLSDARDCSDDEVHLTEKGKEQASALGEALRERKVAVDEVLSSEFCRAWQTAKGVFGEYEHWEALNLLPALPAADADFLMEDVRDRIADFGGEGNLFLVSHRPNVNTITQQNVDAGSMVVMRPEGMGSFDVIGVIDMESLD